MFKGVKTINTNESVVFTATCFDLKGVFIIKLNAYYNKLLCVLRSTVPDYDPVRSKHVTINTTNKIVLTFFTPSIKRKGVKDEFQKT